MELSLVNQILKDDFQLILDGYYNSVMSPKEVRTALELSFLFNHLTQIDGCFLFEYDNIQIKVSFDINSYPIPYEDRIGHTIINMDPFKNCLTKFIRDYKINNLLCL